MDSEWLAHGMQQHKEGRSVLCGAGTGTATPNDASTRAAGYHPSRRLTRKRPLPGRHACVIGALDGRSVNGELVGGTVGQRGVAAVAGAIAQEQGVDGGRPGGDDAHAAAQAAALRAADALHRGVAVGGGAGNGWIRAGQGPGCVHPGDFPTW